MKIDKTDVIILGAGLTGLTIAYELTKADVDVTIIEKSNRCGGVIRTSREKGFLFENGPNTGIIGSPEIGVLLDELKDDLVLQTGDEAVNRRLILKNGKWKALPSGPLSAITTPLFTLSDKFRILAEPFRKKGTNDQETLGQLVLRRMGKSFLDYAIDPFILGVYAGDPSLLVTQYAFPKLFALEQKYGSFIGGTIKKRKLPKTEAEEKATREVFSFENGLEALTNTLIEKIGKENILTSASELCAEKDNNNYVLRGKVKDKDFKLKSTVLISSLNATSLDNTLLPFLPKEPLEALKAVQYAPTVEVVLGFNKWNGIKLEAFGGLIPHKEKRELLGVLFLSAFLPGRAPEGGALLTLFMGGVRNPKWIDASDEEIKQTVEKEICDLMKLEVFKPELFRIIRHKKAIPQYSFESKKKMIELGKLHSQFPGFYLGGNVVDGIGIADRVKQGVQLASKVVTYLGDG